MANPLEEFDEEEFRKRFRLRKDSVIRLSNILKGSLQHQTRRGLPLSPMQQLLVALRCYATGSFERVIGDTFGVSVFAAYTVLHKVPEQEQFIAISAHLQEVKGKFYETAGFPGVVGAIDCTHVRVMYPNRADAMAYVNRKQYYSINVQAVCDSEAMILNIVAHWPGSTHDCGVFENSLIAEKFRNGSIDGILVGDSGYPYRRYLMTPFLHPRTVPERRYNNAQRKTRGAIERCFGILKRRFPCLHSGLRTALQNTLVIIVAMAALNNFAMMQ